MPKQKYKKRDDGRFTATITIGKKPDGSPKRKFVYAYSQAELDKKITELKINFYKGTLADDTMTFEEWSEMWSEVTMKNKAYGTKKENSYLLNKHINPNIGHMKLKDIKPLHIKEIITTMQDNGITETTNKVLKLIRRIFKDAIANDIVYKNPAENIKKIKYAKNEKKPLTAYEDSLLLQVGKQHKYGLFMLIMRYAGLRREEVVALTKDDIDFKNKFILVNKAVTFQHNQPVLKTTKNKKSRKVDLPDILVPLLKKHIANSEYYLFTKCGKPNEIASESALKCWLDSFLYACNLLHEAQQKNINPDFKLDDTNKFKFTFHQLRHSYCTMLYYAGVKIKKAQELMGHSSADMVYDIYTHLDEERENSKDLINNYISTFAYVA